MTAVLKIPKKFNDDPMLLSLLEPKKLRKFYLQQYFICKYNTYLETMQAILKIPLLRPLSQLGGTGVQVKTSN